MAGWSMCRPRRTLNRSVLHPDFQAMTNQARHPIHTTSRLTLDALARQWRHHASPVTARAARVALAACLASLLAACASVSAPPEDIVRERAQARLDAVISGELEKAYGYLSPASRAVVSLDAWRNSLPRATRWTQARVHSVTCEVLDRCNTRVIIYHQPLVMGGRMGTIESAVDEVWVLDAGRWWLLHSR